LFPLRFDGVRDGPEWRIHRADGTDLKGGANHGFIYVDGRFTTTDDPQASLAPGEGTEDFAVNNFGDVVGLSAGSGGTTGFVFHPPHARVGR
jgi:hypothetical protein